MDGLLPQPSDLVPLLPGAGIALVLAVTAARLRDPALRATAGAGAALAGFTGAWLAFRGLPPLPPVQSTERVAFAALGWVVLSAGLAARTTLPWLASYAVRAVAATAAAAWIASPLLNPDRPDAVSWVGVATIGALVALTAELAERASETRGFVSPSVAAVGVGALGPVLLWFGAATLGQLAGGLALALGAVAVASRFDRDRAAAPGTAASAVGIAGLVAADAGWFLDEPPPLLALLALGAATVTGTLTLRGPLASARPLIRTAAALGLAALLAGIGLLVAHGAMPAPDPYGDLYGK